MDAANIPFTVASKRFISWNRVTNTRAPDTSIGRPNAIVLPLMLTILVP